MKISKSNVMYLCDCWIEANEFVMQCFRKEVSEIESLGDMLLEASICHPRANILIWRFLEQNPCYYLTETGEPIALAKNWVGIPSINLEVSGNHIYILRNGILGQGDRKQVFSDDAYTLDVLGAAKGQPIVVNPADWKKFIISQAPDVRIDLQTATGRAEYVGDLWDTGKVTKKAEAVDQLMAMDIKKTTAGQAWAEAQRNDRPEMGKPGRKNTSKN